MGHFERLKGGNLMNIHQIISAGEGWRAVFYCEGEVEINPVIAWGLVNYEHMDSLEGRFVDGLMMTEDRGIVSVTEEDDDVYIFLRYLAPGKVLDKAVLLKRGVKIEKAKKVKT